MRLSSVLVGLLTLMAACNAQAADAKEAVDAYK
jgi:hypothetical protein